MIRKAATGDESKLKRIWMEVFMLENQNSDPLFGEPVNLENILVDEEDGDVVAMLVMSPYDAIIAGHGVHGCYLHSLATLFDYRGRGIMGSMIRAAAEYAKASGYQELFLIPAEGELIPYYEKRGFTKKYYQREIYIRRETLEAYAEKWQAQGGLSLEEAQAPSMGEIWELYKTNLLEASPDRMMLTRSQLEEEIRSLQEDGYHLYGIAHDDLGIGYLLMKAQQEEDGDLELLIAQWVLHADFVKALMEELLTLEFDRLFLSEPVGKLPGKYTKNLISLGCKL